jgi:prepilin peptidase CpaA
MYLVAAAYIGFNVAAAVFDFRQLVIPNTISILLVLLYFVYFALSGRDMDLLHHVAFAACLFAAGVAMFAANLFGGGDVKLLAAVGLWMGFEYAVPFILVVSVLGALLGIVLIAVRRWSKTHETGTGPYVWRRIADMARDGECPYGIAICGGALALAPRLF